MKLSVIIPAYNEEKTIREVIKKVLRAKIKGIDKEIILVNDCSKDRTLEFAKKEKAAGIKIISHSKNLGKGAAIRTGIRHSRGDMIIIQDADSEYDPKEYEKLVRPIIDGKAAVVYGSRLDSIRDNLKYMYKSHYLGNIFLTKVTNFLFGSNLTDMETGYKVFKKEVINGLKLESNGFEIEPEITAKLLKKGHKIYEVPIGFFGRKFSEGKKITWIDGIKAVYFLLKYRISG